MTHGVPAHNPFLHMFEEEDSLSLEQLKQKLEREKEKTEAMHLELT